MEQKIITVPAKGVVFTVDTIVNQNTGSLYVKVGETINFNIFLHQWIKNPYSVSNSWKLDLRLRVEPKNGDGIDDTLLDAELGAHKWLTHHSNYVSVPATVRSTTPEYNGCIDIIEMMDKEGILTELYHSIKQRHPLASWLLTEPQFAALVWYLIVPEGLKDAKPLEHSHTIEWN